MIQIDEEKCNGCGLCVTGCEEGALEIIDGIAKVVSESFCDGLGACIGHCPEDALTLKEVDTVEFDEEAAMEHVRRTRGTEHDSACCPTIDMSEEEAAAVVEEPVTSAKATSHLQNFPVKLKLIAPNHPALKGASLLIMADCTSIAYPSIHDDFIKGKTVVQVCPKFEDFQANMTKLVQIFSANDITDATVVIMDIPISSLIVGVKGEILSSAAV
jgi:NAD-dependent dihydropyrimidine dehydrogenase PreA subunit